MEQAIYEVGKSTTSSLGSISISGSPIFGSFKCDLESRTCLTKEYAENVYVDEIKMNLVPSIKDVRFNDPATIVFFEDGTKTVVKTMEGQEFDPDYGFLLCIMKRVYGDNYHKLMWKHCWGGQEARRAHRKKYKMANKAKDETK